MDVLLYAGFLLLLSDFSVSKYVTIYGPKYTKRNHLIRFNCTTSYQPIAFNAEFKVDGNAYKSISPHQGQCYDGNSVCKLDHCSCTEDGKWYSITYNSGRHASTLTVQCSMRFKGTFQSDTISTEILDLVGPLLEIEPALPLVAGTYAKLVCTINIRNIAVKDVRLSWSCSANSINTEKIYNSTVYSSVYYFVAKSILNGSKCVCIVTVESFIDQTSIELTVKRLPVLDLAEKTFCNSTSTITLSCSISGELSSYGYTPWTHSIKHIVVRKLEGKSYGNTSYLLINSCGYEDSGQYTCKAWNDDGNIRYWSNATSTVAVFGQPIIKSFRINQNRNTTISIQLFSVPDPTKLELYLNDERLLNTSMIMPQITRKPLEHDAYQTVVKVEGFDGSITLAGVQAGLYILRVKNMFGETQQAITLKGEGLVFFIHSIMWVVITAAVVIITIAISTILNRFAHTINYSLQEQRVAIYHAAPQIETEHRIYDTTDTHNEFYRTPVQYFEVISSQENITLNGGVITTEVPHYEEIK